MHFMENDMFNTGLDDEVFICSELNLVVNIDELIEYLNENASKYKVIELNTVDFDNFILADRLEEETIEKMSDVRMNEPLICADLCGCVRVIDGNHRLAKRKKLKLDSCRAVMIPFQILSKFIEPCSDLPKRAYKKWFDSLQNENA